MSHISTWFVCKVCSSYFLTVSDFLEHKKEKHFAEFRKTTCIVFAEQPQDQNQEQDFDSNQAEVDYDFLDLKCDLFTHGTSPTHANTDEISTGSSNSVNYLDGIKLEVELDHSRPPQCEPYVLLRRLTKKQLETAHKLNAKVPEGSSPNNEITTNNSSRCRRRKFPKSKYLTPAVRPVCHTCSKSFTNKYVLNIHLARAHSTGRKFSCKCGKTYKCLEDLRGHNIYHKTRKENGLEYRIQCLQDFGKRKKKREAVNKLVSAKKIRELVGPSKSDLNLEAQISNKVNVDVLNDPNNCVSQNKPKSKILSPAVRPVCHTCSKSFKNKYVLNVHLARAHSTGRKFSCKCGKAFNCLENLRNHKICQKLRKNKGLTYSMKCVEDYAERQKKQNGKRYKSTSLERSAEHLPATPSTMECTSESRKNISKTVEPSTSAVNLETDKVTNNVNVDVLNDPSNCVSQRKPKSKFLAPVVRPVCHTCSKSFKNKYVLNIHLARAHSTGRDFSCKCGKTFKCFEDLKGHKIAQKLRKEKGLNYSKQCLEDYAERKKKNGK